jgi:predicted negative regulator of RcsB-dependent stress response
MAAKRQTRKELLKTQDRFQIFSTQTVDWARDNPKIVIAAVAALILLLIGVVWFVNYQASARARVRQLYASAAAPLNYPKGYITQYRSQNFVYGGLLLSDTMPFGLGPKVLLKMIDDYPEDLAQEGFAHLVAVRPSSTLGQLALLRLAALARDRGRPLTAARYLRRFLAVSDLEPALIPPAQLALGQVLETAGRRAEAARTFGAITTPGFRELGQFNQTRILAEQARAAGQVATARRLWREFLAKFPKTVHRGMIEQIIESWAKAPGQGS